MRIDAMLGSASPISGAHYSLVRFLMGLYLMVHCLHLLPYGVELFSAQGLFLAEASPLMGILPNPITFADTPGMILFLLSIGALCGLCQAIGYRDRLAAGLGALILAWLFARNPLIANPSLPVIGWLLILHLFVPRGVYGAWHSRSNAAAWQRWRLPNGLWLACWLMLAVAYSYSGYTKLLSPSWVDGSAIERVLNNPLARDHLLNDALLALPAAVLQGLTWTVLCIELLFLPLALFRRSRLWVWLAMLCIQFGFLLCLNFADLTFPMLLIHALTFDPGWVGRASRPSDMKPASDHNGLSGPVLFFDGYCAFCNATIRFVLAEDRAARLKVAPLDHPMIESLSISLPEGDSIVLVEPDGTALFKSSAVIVVLGELGGLWRIASIVLSWIPRRLRDAGYDAIGRIRYRLAGRMKTHCERLPEDWQDRVLRS